MAVIHDENMNGKLDTNWMSSPKEGFGFSNNAAALLSAPSFPAVSLVRWAEYRYNDEPTLRSAHRMSIEDVYFRSSIKHSHSGVFLLTRALQTTKQRAAALKRSAVYAMRVTEVPLS